MISSERYPSHLVFDHEPSDVELTKVLGPDFVASRALWIEDDESISIQSPAFPYYRAVAAMLLLCILITSWPWLMSWMLGESKSTPELTFLSVAAVLWLVMVPVMILMLRKARGKLAERKPGLHLDKRRREIRLPWLGEVVPEAQIMGFVELQGRRHYRGGRVSPYRQQAVLFRDDKGRVVYAPFARLAARSLRMSCAARLAGYFDRQIQVIKAGAL